MKIIPIKYDDTICPNCGGIIANHRNNYKGSCYFSECCDEGGGTTDYIVICHKGD